MSIAYIVSAVSILYGLSWLLFAIIDPPPSLTFFYRSPGALTYLPERVGRVVVAAVFLVVIPMFASILVGLFIK